MTVVMGKRNLEKYYRLLLLIGYLVPIILASLLQFNNLFNLLKATYWEFLWVKKCLLLNI